ncbi:hypothetical protein BFJ63_vAg19595, partial [Fusarium oxysporum f. sp. narcissi]
MPEEPPRRRGRPRKVHTEEERLAAQREHSQKYRQRVQQDKGESLSFTGYYQHIPYVPTSSSAMAQLPPHIVLPNDSYLPLDLSCGDPGQPSSLSYGDNTAAHDGPSYDLGDYCPFDSDSTTSHESTASSASTRDCQVLFSDLPTEYIRNHRSEQGDEIQELLEAFGNGLHISPTASQDDLRQDFDTLSSDEEVSEPGHRSLDTSHEEQTVPSLERYLAREWTEHPSCSRQSHKEDHEELAKNKCHRSCDSLNDVAARLDGLIGDENNRHPLPNVMDPSFDLLSHTQHTEPANNEGTSRNSPPLNN